MNKKIFLIAAALLVAGFGCKSAVDPLQEEVKKFESSGIASFTEAELELLTSAQTLQIQERHEEAISIFGTLLADHPNEPNVWNDMAVSYGELGEIKLALYAHRQAVESAEQDPLYADGTDFMQDYITYCQLAGVVLECLDGYDALFAKAPTLEYEHQKKNAAYVLRDAAVALEDAGDTMRAARAATLSAQLVANLTADQLQ